MDLSLDAGLIAFTMAVATLALDWILQSFLTLRYGPRVTRDLVIAEFKNKAVATTVREALDLPNRAEILAVREEIKSLDLAYTTALDARLAGVIRDMNAAVAGVPKPDLAGLEARLRDAVAHIRPDLSGLDTVVQDSIKNAVTSQAKAQLSREARAANEQREEMMAQYMASAGAQQDAKQIYGFLRNMGIQEGMAQVAAQFGPNGVSWALEQTMGKKAAESFTEKMMAARMAQMPINQILRV